MVLGDNFHSLGSQELPSVFIATISAGAIKAVSDTATTCTLLVTNLLTYSGRHAVYRSTNGASYSSLAGSVLTYSGVLRR